MMKSPQENDNRFSPRNFGTTLGKFVRQHPVRAAYMTLGLLSLPGFVDAMFIHNALAPAGTLEGNFGGASSFGEAVALLAGGVDSLASNIPHTTRR